VTVSGHWATICDSQGAEAVVLQLEDPIGIVEWERPLEKGHWLEVKEHGL
jgi:hypothetical protein